MTHKSKIQFNSKLEIKGNWWLPGDPRKKVAGTLSYSPGNSIKLKVESFISKKNQNGYEKAIHGVSIDGIKISLFECCRVNSVSSSIGYSSHSFYISIAFFGAHFQEKEISNLKFEKMILYFSNFEDWLGAYAISHNGYDSKMRNNKGDGFALTYKRPSLPSFKIQENKLEIKLCSEVTISHNSRHHKELIHKCSLCINPEKEKLFDWFQKTANDLKDFLSLVSDTQSLYTQMLLYFKDKTENYVSVLHSVMDPSYKINKTLHPSQMIVSFPQIKENFEEIIDLWFKKSNKLRPVFDLFFSLRRNKKLYVESQFLSLIQAVEIFHREKASSSKSKYVEEKEFDKFKEKIESAIQDWPDKNGLKESFSQRLKYANEYSLRQRLKEIFNSLDDGFLDVFFKNDEQFIKDVIILRNNLTHRGPKKGKDYRNKLDRCKIRLSVLLSYLILNEIKVPVNLIVEGLIRKRKHYFD